jgi:hypothetical protein
VDETGVLVDFGKSNYVTKVKCDYPKQYNSKNNISANHKHIAPDLVDETSDCK